MSDNINSPSTLINTAPFSKKPLAIDTVINGYQIRDYLNEDLFGINYSARHQQTNKKVVIHEYFPSEIAIREQDGSIHPKENASDKENFNYGLTQFKQEVEALLTLKHRNIITIKECFNENGTIYSVTKYYQGQTLKQWLTLTRSLNKPPLTEKKLLNIIVPVLDALKLLHENDCLHRNIKPENIFLSSDNIPLLINFGAAQQALADKTGNLNLALATGYAPKEQYSGDNDLNASVDIYALSATLYYAMTYEVPIDSLNRGKAFDEKSPEPLTPAVQAGKNDYRKEFLTVVDQGLAYLPKNRPQTAVEFKKLLIDQQYKNRKKASSFNKSSAKESKTSQVSELILLGLLLFILVQKVVEKIESSELFAIETPVTAPTDLSSPQVSTENKIE